MVNHADGIGGGTDREYVSCPRTLVSSLVARICPLSEVLSFSAMVQS